MIVNTYIDGFNFYHGLKAKGRKKYYWLAVVTLFEKFLQEGDELGRLYYFSAEPKHNRPKQRQSQFFSANRSNKKFKLVLGKFIEKEIELSDGTIHTTFEEKETDVNIAVQMIEDVVFGNCEKSILVSGDNDLAEPIRFISKHNPDHKVGIIFPPERFSNLLMELSGFHIPSSRYEARMKNSLLPDEVKMTNGGKVYRPNSWQ